MSQSSFLWKTPRYPRSHTVRITETTTDTTPVDRISSLPIEITRKILFRVSPKDVARTSVLSKKWRSTWASLTDIYLDELVFGENCTTFSYTDTEKAKRAAFLTYLEKSLEICEEYAREHNGEIGTLFLRMRDCANPYSELLIRRWIDFALKNKVKTLHLVIGRFYDRNSHTMFYSLSGVTWSSTTLVVLCIKDCQISSSCKIKLPNLLSLFLYSVSTDENFVFRDFLMGFPGLEELILDYYPEELDKIVVPNLSLKFLKVVITACSGLLEIKSKKLESLELVLFRVDNSKLVKIACPSSVKNLTLDRVYLHERTLMNFISRFPQLENLVINGCGRDIFSDFSNGVYHGDKLPRLFVSHQNLKNFVMKIRAENSTTLLDEIIIDCPNLKSLEYSGGRMSFTGMKALESVKFHLRPKTLDASWYVWLRNILKTFGQSKHLSLICCNEQDVIFPAKLTEKLLPAIHDIKNLELEVDSSTITTQEILAGFIWILPGLKTLSLTLGSISKLIEFQSEDEVKKVTSATAKVKVQH